MFVLSLAMPSLFDLCVDYDSNLGVSKWVHQADIK